MTLKQVREILNRAKFNPRAPGPLNIVANSAGPVYLESRAIEYIMEAQELRDESEFYEIKMIRAIQCLAMATIQVQDAKKETGD